MRKFQVQDGFLYLAIDGVGYRVLGWKDGQDSELFLVLMNMKTNNLDDEISYERVKVEGKVFSKRDDLNTFLNPAKDSTEKGKLVDNGRRSSRMTRRS